MNIKLKVDKIKTISMIDANYPEKLKHIYAKPQTLYVLGNVDLLNEKSIAIVGCRDYTEYGKRNAYKFAYELAKEGVCIISGMAKGIDTFAHLGALNANGKTIAVLRKWTRRSLSARKHVALQRYYSKKWCSYYRISIRD